MTTFFKAFRDSILRIVIKTILDIDLLNWNKIAKFAYSKKRKETKYGKRA